MSDAPQPTPQQPQRGHRRLVLQLLGLTAGSAAFGFALVPLYDTLCRQFGINGKSSVNAGEEKDATPGKVDLDRSVTVQFMSTLMPGLPWEIRPLETSVSVHPGELRTTRFLVRNASGEAVTGQAVPSISPGQAAAHLKKIECFCFRQQALGPGESKELPLTFFIDSDIDPNIRELTLAYAFFPAPANPKGGPQ
ncbi:MAG: cytochrome c oxidase assembly protein [Rhodocyclaceae bacterium]|nr:MAG: cytochrome c oxidase assembly protein [Rhodocyclaceae bacterium]